MKKRPSNPASVIGWLLGFWLAVPLPLWLLATAFVGRIEFFPMKKNAIGMLWALGFYGPLALIAVGAVIRVLRYRGQAGDGGLNKIGIGDPAFPRIASWPIGIGGAFAGLTAIAIFATFPWPTYDRATLKAVKVESRILMRTSPSGTVPKNRWPPAIAGLQPEQVWVSTDGVHILTHPFFDGGWGYFVARDEQAKRGWPKQSKLAEGIYWWYPY